MKHTQQQIAEMTLELCKEAIAQRCATGKVEIKDFTLYAETLENCEFALQYYKDTGEQTEW